MGKFDPAVADVEDVDMFRSRVFPNSETEEVLASLLLVDLVLGTLIVLIFKCKILDKYFKLPISKSYYMRHIFLINKIYYF